MLPANRIEGKSLPLNIVAIVLNLAGLYLLAFDFLYEDLSLFQQILGYVLFFLGLVGLVFLEGLYMFSYVSRAIVGGLFIVSGLIKANDPMGFAYKLEEYFMEDALNMPYLEDYVIHISIFICIVEIILGAALILGGKIKLTSWSLLLMIGFFLWLTYYTASCNEMQAEALANGEEFSRMCVTDCGCFGDAFRGSFGRPLNPWESFMKDVVLLYLILVIFVNQWKIKINTANENLVMIASSLVVVSFLCWVFSWWFPLLFSSIILFGSLLFGNGIRIKFLDRSWTMALFVTIVSFLLSMYTLNYLPIKDYRPYHIGANLYEKMKDGVPPVVEKQFKVKDKETGEEKYISQEEYMANENWKKYEVIEGSTVEKTIKEGKPTSIQDFAPNARYEDLSESMKSDLIIDSIFKANKDEYYHDIAIVKYIGDPANSYTDTIALQDYSDTLYPDSMFNVLGKGTYLINPNKPFTLDMKDFILHQEKIIMIVMRKVDEALGSGLDDLVELVKAAKDDGIPVVILTSSTREKVIELQREYELDVPFLATDDIELKKIVRSNPGVLTISNAVVKGKWPSRRIPDLETINDSFEN